MFSDHRRYALPSSFLLSAALGLAVCGTAAAAEIRYSPGDNIQFTYCFSHPPVLRIRPGDSVITSTRDASNDVYSVGDKTIFPKLDLTKVNPQTGPFFIEGAEPGDTLVVHIDKIDLNRDWGWGGSIPYFGTLAPEYKTMMITPPVQDTFRDGRRHSGRSLLRRFSFCAPLVSRGRGSVNGTPSRRHYGH